MAPSKPVNIDDVAARLKICREVVGLSHQAAADLISQDRSTWTGWENGNRYPPVDRISKFCDRYGFTLDWIYRGIPHGLPNEIADKILAACDKHLIN